MRLRNSDKAWLLSIGFAAIATYRTTPQEPFWATLYVVSIVCMVVAFNIQDD